MLTNLLLPPLLALMLGGYIGVKPKPAAQLLTQKAWILTSTGVDENRNGLIDAIEESICECEKDNCYKFNVNGTGLVEESSLECGNGVLEMPFCWRLVNNDTAIDCNNAHFKILRLSEDELIIYQEISGEKIQPLKIISRFRH